MYIISFSSSVCIIQFSAKPAHLQGAHSQPSQDCKRCCLEIIINEQMYTTSHYNQYSTKGKVTLASKA
jgi:hypothetical protein